MPQINSTHDARLKSWVESANRSGGDFPIQNLPHGVFRRPGQSARGGVAIGDSILDIQACVDAGLLDGEAASAAAEPTLNRLLAGGADSASGLRASVSALLSDQGREGEAARARAGDILAPMSEVEVLLPVSVGSFTDFLCSFYHSTYARKGRAEIALDKAFFHLPIAYNSRASTVVASGHPYVRPNGQGLDGETGRPYFEPSRKADFELELGAFFGGPGNPIGQPIPLRRAEDHLFGHVLLNDWTSRDIQRWENRLGPFLGKSALTTISPWIVTLEALAPFRAPAFVRRPGDPALFPYLDDPHNQAAGSLDLAMTAYLLTPKMRAAGTAPALICETNFKAAALWNFGQMLAHHTSNGCSLRPGDLMGSGTCSGEAESAAGCMSEITSGVVPLELPGGESRLWLEDGDEIQLRARAERDGFVGIGFGPCDGQLQPAVNYGAL